MAKEIDIKVLFGQRLRAVRKMRGMTLDDLSRRADIGPKHIAGIERGEKVPSFEAIGSLAKALRVLPYELFLPDRSEAENLRSLVADIEQNATETTKRHLALMLAWGRQIEYQGL